MLAPLSWLKEYVDVDKDPVDIERDLNLSGTAVEKLHVQKPEFSGVFTAQIEKIEPHPDADKLVVCTVNTGSESLEIVCGAKNMKAGDKVAAALDGAVLKGDYKIKRSKIRGVVSNGMLCSEEELGLADSADGIMILPTQTPLGVPLSDAVPLGDATFELEVMPNRPDCLSMVGVARELKALYDKKLVVPVPKVNEVKTTAASTVDITIDEHELCPRYSARVVKGIKVGPSPTWVKSRLENAGVRSINNVVDVTNYVMLELGQPLHAFDVNKLRGPRIVVRLAKKNEKIKCLDDVERTLRPTDLVIADEKRAVAIAGVMGGSATEVDDQTVDILLESANFERTNVMATSKGLGLFTESSRRFERGADPSGTVLALDRAADLIVQFAGGNVLKGVIDIHPKKTKPVELVLRHNRIAQILGASIRSAHVVKILKNLDIEVMHTLGKEIKGDLTYNVRIPTFRVDLEREIDLIEELARFFGYYNIPSSLPHSRQRAGILTARQKAVHKVHSILSGIGISQASNLSFTSSSTDVRDILDSAVLHDHLSGGAHFSLHEIEKEIKEGRSSTASGVRIRNPLSTEFSYLRRSLLPGLLKNVVHNVNRGSSRVFLYELGKAYHPSNDILPEERELVSFVLAGPKNEKSWHSHQVETDMFDGKGMLEVLLSRLGVKKWNYVQSSNGLFNPARGVDLFVKGTTAGCLGELHPELAAHLELTGRTVLAEMDLDVVLSAAQEDRTYRELDRFPEVRYDLALLVDDQVSHESIQKNIRQLGGNLLASSKLFDVYQGDKVPSGKKSLAYSLEFRSPEKTLTDEDVHRSVKKIVDGLKKSTGAELRS